MKQALIIVDYAGYLREEFYPACGIDTDAIAEELAAVGYEARVCAFDELASGGWREVEDHLIVYSSSQQPEYKLYIDDILYHLKEFVPGLLEDWKVIATFDRMYTFRRGVRDGDFRASGSGKFDFAAEPPNALLDFAADVFAKLDVPFLSMDICKTAEGYARA